MAKNKRIKIDSVDLEGKKKEVYIKLPSSEENKKQRFPSTGPDFIL